MGAAVAVVLDVVVSANQRKTTHAAIYAGVRFPFARNHGKKPTDRMLKIQVYFENLMECFLSSRSNFIQSLQFHFSRGYLLFK